MQTSSSVQRGANKSRTGYRRTSKPGNPYRIQQSNTSLFLHPKRAQARLPSPAPSPLGDALCLRSPSVSRPARCRLCVGSRSRIGKGGDRDFRSRICRCLVNAGQCGTHNCQLRLPEVAGRKRLIKDRQMDPCGGWGLHLSVLPDRHPSIYRLRHHHSHNRYLRSWTPRRHHRQRHWRI